jgi:hypothetical protein
MADFATSVVLTGAEACVGFFEALCPIAPATVAARTKAIAMRSTPRFCPQFIYLIV